MVRRINLEHPHQEPSFKRINQLDTPVPIMSFKTTLPFRLIVLNYFPVMQDKCPILIN
jgi:hypothetical protein